MTNYEHYKKEIEEIILSGDDIAIDKVENKPTYCSKTNCENCLGFATGHCKSRAEWFNAEYKEPVIEIDWEKVPVDTKILVRDRKTDNWSRRYFAEYKNGIVYVFPLGLTSWSDDDGTVIDWEYTELADPEDIEKYRKR